MIAPAQKTVAQGWEAGFNCQHSTADAIGWRLNGTTFLDKSLEGVSASSTSLAGGVLNTLTIVAHPEYNQTRIGCVAFFDTCLLYTSPSPRDATLSRMPSSA